MFSTIAAKIRHLIEENLKSGTDIFTYGSSDIFTLTELNISAVTTVFKNDVELDSGDWSYDSDTNKLTLSVSGVSSGDVIQVDYTYYPNYSLAELQNYIQASILQLSINNFKTFVVNSTNINPEPTEREQNLIAAIAGILIRPGNITYRLPDITYTVPSTSLTKEEMIRKVIGIYKKDSHGIFNLIDSQRYI
jgi:hypothetical protein